MMEARDVFDMKDELNLYLVAHGLKPAALPAVDPKSPHLHKLAEMEEGKFLWIGTVTWRLKQGVVEDVNHMLDKGGVSYKGSIHPCVGVMRNHRRFFSIPISIPVMRETNLRYEISVGKDKGSLERLLRATPGRELGLVLGYPTEAVEAYGKLIDDEVRNGNYLAISLAKAKQAGTELPLWLAYICFVPEKLDLVHGNVSRSSEQLGRSYQDFVRQNNPELAERVEQHFRNFKFPDRWEKQKDGGYMQIWDASTLMKK